MSFQAQTPCEWHAVSMDDSMQLRFYIHLLYFIHKYLALPRYLKTVDVIYRKSLATGQTLQYNALVLLTTTHPGVFAINSLYTRDERNGLIAH